MLKDKYFLPIYLIFICLGFSFSVTAQQQKTTGYVLDHEKELKVSQPGPHNGSGTTTGFSFFAKTPNLNLVFRKRILHPGSSIGYHFQENDEIYYVVSGKGEMKMNGEIIPMNPGDAILTRPGSSHGLTQVGKEDLVIIISYDQHPPKDGMPTTKPENKK